MKITISLQDELVEKLKKESEETGIPMSRIIAIELKKRFEKNGEVEKKGE